MARATTSRETDPEELAALESLGFTERWLAEVLTPRPMELARGDVVVCLPDRAVLRVWWVLGRRVVVLADPALAVPAEAELVKVAMRWDP